MSQDTSQAHRKTAKKGPFLHYVKQNPRVFTLGVITLLFTDLFDVLTPLALKAGIDAIEGGNPRNLYWAVAAYIGLMTGVAVFRFGWRIYFGRFHHSVAHDLRAKIFDKLTTLGPTFYQKKSVGELMSLLTNDVNSFRMAIGPGVLILLDAAFLIAMTLPLMAMVSWEWTWRTLIFLPFVPFFMKRMEKLIHDRFTVQQERLAEVSANSAEIVSGIRVIKGFAQEENQTRSFNAKSKDYELACNRVSKVDAAFHPVMDGAVAMGTVILLWLCTPEVIAGTITIGTFVAFHEFIRRMAWPMSAIGIGASMMEQGRASYKRIHDLLDTATDIPDSGTTVIERFEKIEVRDLTFRYDGAPTNALTNLSLTIRAGETIGIVGPVGAGKTTLLQLLCRLYPVEKGRIEINGIDIGEIRRSSLSSTLSLVPQDAFLFSDTVADNVAFGFDTFPGLEPVQEVATSVNIDQEIHELPHKYDSQLGERGVNLSGGQKQRLTIARALIRRSPVVMLDDSLSAVDGRTEHLITRSLQEARALNPQQTVVIVSHRLATLKHADRIVVLSRGTIEAVGTHAELLGTSATYRHLNELQSGLTVDEAADARETGGVA